MSSTINLLTLVKLTMEEIVIKWSGPYNLQTVGRHSISDNFGIYAFTRVWGGNEILLYIGKTERDFARRMKEHQVDWLHKVGGQIRVRFGVLEMLDGRRYTSEKLADIESLLIAWHKPCENTSSVNYYYGREKIRAINMGRRGPLKRQVCSDEDFV